MIFSASKLKKSLFQQRLHETINRWKQHFLSEDFSSERHTIYAVQRSALWIALALMLQALAGLLHFLTTTQYGSFIPSLIPLGALLPFPLLLGSFWAMGIACRSTSVSCSMRWRPADIQHILLVLTLVMALIGIFQGSQAVVQSFLPAQFLNDGTALDMNAASLLLQGRNPYTDSKLLDVAKHLTLPVEWTTPLRRGRFAGQLNYPSLNELRTVLADDLKSGSTQEFESQVSYPALCFLSLAPLALMHIQNVVPFSLLSYLLLVALGWRQARPSLRPWMVLLAAANAPMWSLTFGDHLDLLCTLLLTLAWLQQERRWASAFLFGLALASKQLAWFFLPFYCVLMWRHKGLPEAIFRLTIAGGTALAFNLPFLLWNVHAWLAGVLAPVADPMFPLGIGLIDLSIIHVLPFFPSWVYLILEGMALLAALACYWWLCPGYPEIAMLLAVLPLVFAWRSLPSYFAGAAYPLFILLVTRKQAEVSVVRE